MKRVITGRQGPCRLFDLATQQTSPHRAPLRHMKEQRLSKRSESTLAADHTYFQQDRPYNEIPTTQNYSLPLVGNGYTYMKKDNIGKMHKIQQQYHANLGPIYREKIGPQELVFVCGPRAAAELAAKTNSNPVRPPVTPWEEYAKYRQRPRGVTTERGEKWENYRRVLNKDMLVPRQVASYDKQMTPVITDFLEGLGKKLNAEGKVPDLYTQIQRFSIEAMGRILLGQKLGLLEDHAPDRSEKIFQCTNEIVCSTERLFFMPALQRRLRTKSWKTMVDAWDSLHEITETALLEQLELPPEELPPILRHLLHHSSMSLAETRGNIVDFLLGSAETTASSFVFALYCLARTPTVQTDLRKQLHAATRAGELPDASTVSQVPLVSTTLKETLRLFPVAPNNARLITRETTIEGFAIPEGKYVVLSNYAMGRDEETFPKASEFHPDRWDKNSPMKPPQYASVPFGFGARLCPGKRIASLLLHLGLLQTVDTYSLGVDVSFGLDPIMSTVLRPGNDVPITFHARAESS